MSIWRNGGIASLQSSAVFKIQNFRFYTEKNSLRTKFFMKTQGNQKEGRSNQGSVWGIHQKYQRFVLTFFFFNFFFLPLFTFSKWVLLYKLFWSPLSPALELLQLVFMCSVFNCLSAESESSTPQHSVTHGSYCSGEYLMTDARSVHKTLGWPCCRITSNLGACLNVYITSRSPEKEDCQYPLADMEEERHNTVGVYVTKLSLHFRMAYTYCVRKVIQLPGAEPHRITTETPLVFSAWCHTTRCLDISEKSFDESVWAGI